MNSVWTRAMMVAAVVVALLCGGVRAQTDEIGGVVVDKSGDPVAGATFSVLTMQPGTVWQFDIITGQTETDQNGRFSLTGDQAAMKGMYSFYVVQHPDYGVTWALSVLLSQRGQSASDMKFVLPERGAVQGTVTDSTGDPVEGAVVSALITLKDVSPESGMPFLPPCEPLLKATSGEDGGFVLDGLPAKASVMIRVKHPDFAGAVEGVPANMQGMPEGTISVGATDVTVELEPRATIEGTVSIEESGEPAEGAVVNAMPERNDLTALVVGPESAETDADGRYVLSGLAASTYTVKVTHPDGTAAPKRIEVAVGARLTGQDVVLGRGVLVSGRFVYAETGEAVSGGQVMAMRRDAMGLSGQTLVDLQPDGTFSFRQPPGGISLIGFTQTGGNAQVQLTLVDGEDQTDVLLEIEPPVMFTGKVVGPDGEGVVGALVASRRGGRPTTTTENGGAFKLSLPGQRFAEYEYALLIATHPDMPELRGVLRQPMMDESDAEGVIEMVRTGSIFGRVVDVDGEPIVDASVRSFFRFENSSTSDGTATTDNAGRFEFTDIVGEQQYYFQAQAEGYGQDSSENFSVEGGGTHDVGDLVIQIADMTIEGTVIDEDGEPLAGVQVQGNGSGTPYRSTQTDNDGHFRLENLVDEEVRIHAYYQGPDGYLSANVQTMAGDTDIEIMMRTQPVRVTAGEQAARRIAGNQAFEIEVAEWVNGEETSLEDLEGTIVVLAFWDSTHKSAAEVVEALNVLTNERPDVAVIAVHSAEADRDALQEFVENEDIVFRVALDNPSSGRFPGLTFESYRVRRPAAVFVIDPNSTVKFQDIPLGVLREAIDNVPTEVQPDAPRGPREQGAAASRGQVSDAGGSAQARASCANNLKQMGIVFKMYANEHEGYRWPQIDNRRGNLMPEGDEIYPEYLTDLNVLRCPGSLLLGGEPEPLNSADDITDETYFYLGWVVTTEEEGLALLDAYESLEPDQYGEDVVVGEGKGNGGGDRIFRLREGAERFLITDINASAAPARTQGDIPVMWDRPGNHDPEGGNVLFMDGHVAFFRYPGKFPMTEAFIKRCEDISATKEED